MLLVSKFFNDVYFSNQYIASVSGISLRLLNEIERTLIKLIDYNIFISGEEFEYYTRGLETKNAHEQRQLQELVNCATQPIFPSF